MISHRQLVHEWHARLGDYRRQLADRRSRWPWIARAYVRVLTFLLRQYGSETDSLDLSLAGSRALPPLDAGLPQSRMPLVVATDVKDGKPAKRAATIRAVLENLHEANPIAPTGTGNPSRPTIGWRWIVVYGLVGAFCGALLAHSFEPGWEDFKAYGPVFIAIGAHAGFCFGWLLLRLADLNR